MNLFAKSAAKAVLGGMILFLAASGTPDTARADEAEDLIHVVSNVFPGRSYVFGVVTDEQGDLTGISYREAGHRPVLSSLEQLSRGVVLLHNDSPSLDVIRMRAEGDFTSQNGGALHIYYMGSALRPHKYGDFVVELVRNGTNWLTYSVYNHCRSDKPTDHLEIEGNYLFGQVIGVANVRVK